MRTDRSRPRAGLAITLGLALAHPGDAQAQMPVFLASCMADAGDLQRLPGSLARAGMVEIDPANGPSGPMAAAGAPGRRLWSARRGPGKGDAFAGYAPASAGRPLEICWTVSRPGRSAANMLTELKRLFPPPQGVTETGTTAFYGGYERWSVVLHGKVIVLGVDWAIQANPEQGTGLLYLVKSTQ